MANPLAELELVQTSFQRIQEIAIAATPAKVWSSVIHPGNWFGFDPDKSNWPKTTLELHAGGRWFSEGKDGTQMFMGTVSYFEPGKLLRIIGQLGMTHLPVMNVFIFELQPKNDGKSTLLRLGHRCFGFASPDTETRVAGGWTKLLGQLKDSAEKA